MRRGSYTSALLLSVALLLAVPLASPRPALAASPQIAAALRRGKAAYGKQDYERTLKLLQPVVIDPKTTISQKIDALELLGLSYLILGDNKRSREAFENLLGLDPAHQLRDRSGSPKLRQFFLAVKEHFLPGFNSSEQAQLEHRAPRGARAGRRVEFSVVVRSAVVTQVVIRWRRAGLLTYRQARAKVRGRQRVAAFLLPEDRESYRLEYYVEARGGSGHAVARLGSPGHPLSLKVEGSQGRRRSEPVYKRWWFWTAIGVAVVGGTVAAIAASRKAAPEGSLGSITLEARSGGGALLRF